jgi:hypothetical protein
MLLSVKFLSFIDVKRIWISGGVCLIEIIQAATIPVAQQMQVCNPTFSNSTA